MTRRAYRGRDRRQLPAEQVKVKSKKVRKEIEVTLPDGQKVRRRVRVTVLEMAEKVCPPIGHIEMDLMDSLQHGEW